MKTVRTKPHSTYITPNIEEMKEVANKVNLKDFSQEMAEDLCNLASGGKICLPSEYAQKVKQSLKDSKNFEYDFSKKMKGHQRVCDFLQNIDLDKMEGQTPLEKSMFCLKLLSSQKGSSGSGDSDTLSIFSDNYETPESVAKTLSDVLDTIENLSETEKMMINPENRELSKLEVAEDLKEGSQKETMLRISRLLDNFTKLQVSKNTQIVTDPQGETTRQRPMQSMSELAMLGGSDWAMYKANKSYFMYQAATGQMNVREKITKLERKQAIFILVDGSGSMSGTRHHKATGVVMNRLKAVLKGDAVVFISVFDTQMNEPDLAGTPEQAQNLIKKFAKGNYSGGGTDIAVAVKSAHQFIQNEIKKGELLYRPEIIVLTDDDESANGVNASQIVGSKVHGFAIESQNENLKRLAESTGGLFFDRNNF